MAIVEQSPRAQPSTTPLAAAAAAPTAPVGAHRAVVLSSSAVMRAGLRRMTPDQDVEVVAEVADREGLRDCVSANGARLVIAALPDGGSEDLFHTLHALPHGCSAIVLLTAVGYRIQASVVTSRFDITCLPLGVGREELHGAIRDLLSGETPAAAGQRQGGVATTALTVREQGVLRELAQGKGSRDIAAALWLSEDTVKTHLRRIYRKLGVRSRTEAVACSVGQLGEAGGPRAVARPPPPATPRMTPAAARPHGSSRASGGLRAAVHRAVVVSEVALVRAGLRGLVDDCRGVEVHGERDTFDCLAAAVETARAQLVVAAREEGGHDEQQLSVLAALPRACRVLVLLPVPGFRIVSAAVRRRHGLACLPLDIQPQALDTSIEGALRGRAGELEVQEICAGPGGMLTPREQEVLQELALGRTNAEISASLFLSQDTVKSHLRKIYRKLGVTSRAQAVALYLGTLGSS
jgi:DNA-binding NarL/FixJ family response regulator